MNYMVFNLILYLMRRKQFASNLVEMFMIIIPMFLCVDQSWFAVLK